MTAQLQQNNLSSKMTRIHNISYSSEESSTSIQRKQKQKLHLTVTTSESSKTSWLKLKFYNRHYPALLCYPNVYLKTGCLWRKVIWIFDIINTYERFSLFERKHSAWQKMRQCPIVNGLLKNKGIMTHCQQKLRTVCYQTADISLSDVGQSYEKTDSFNENIEMDLSKALKVHTSW